MAFFGKKNTDGGILDVIRCDEESYLIWKWHPDKVKRGEGARENSIIWGSSLRVKEGSVAVFVNNQKNGIYQDFIEGPYDGFLTTDNLPVISRLFQKLYDGKSPFQAEVYFINIAGIVQIPFGVPYFMVYDNMNPEFGVPVAVRGTITFRIVDYRHFVKLHRMDHFDVETFKNQVRDAITNEIKSIVLGLYKQSNQSVIHIGNMISEITTISKKNIGERFRNDFGVELTALDISDIEVDKSSEDYNELLNITRDTKKRIVEANTSADVEDIREMRRIDRENYSETLRIQREEDQYAKHLKAQADNLEVHRINQQANVSVAGADALGRMGENGAFNNAFGANNVASMAGMMLGGAIGQNLNNNMNHIISEEAPPPIPSADIAYYVAINRKSCGPYNLSKLKEMFSAGQLTTESLVWKKGMSNWEKAGSISELQALFNHS